MITSLDHTCKFFFALGVSGVSGGLIIGLGAGDESAGKNISGEDARDRLVAEVGAVSKLSSVPTSEIPLGRASDVESSEAIDLCL